eukprot:6172084-Pleurochrysis_carterae.AAC.2
MASETFTEVGPPRARTVLAPGCWHRGSAGARPAEGRRRRTLFAGALAVHHVVLSYASAQYPPRN